MIATPAVLRRQMVEAFFTEGVEAYIESHQRHGRLTAEAKATMHESCKRLMNLGAEGHARALLRMARIDLSFDEYADWHTLLMTNDQLAMTNY